MRETSQNDRSGREPRDSGRLRSAQWARSRTQGTSVFARTHAGDSTRPRPDGRGLVCAGVR
jgi:hypothetical protein